MANILGKYKHFILESHLGDKSFEDFTIFLINKETITLTREFLTYIYKDHMDEIINTRIFLSIFLIHYRHQDVLSSQKNILEKEVFKESKKLCKQILDLNTTYLTDIILSLKKWNILFQYWKNLDKKDLLQQLAKYHKEIRNLYDNNLFEKDDKTQLDDKQQLIKKVEHLANRIDNNKGIEHVRTASKYGMIDNELLLEQVSKQMKKSFWDIFTNDLKCNPPNWKQFPQIINDIQLKFKNILPKSNYEENAKIIHSQLNSKHIILKMKNQTFDLQYIYDIISFSLYKLLELHNSILEDKIKEMIKDLDKNIKINETFILEIPRYLEFILTELEIIENYKKIFSKNGSNN